MLRTIAPQPPGLASRAALEQNTDDVPRVQVRAAGAGAGLLPADLLPPRGRGRDLGGLASDGRPLHPLPDVPHPAQGSHVSTNTGNRYEAPLMMRLQYFSFQCHQAICVHPDQDARM